MLRTSTKIQLALDIVDPKKQTESTRYLKIESKRGVEGEQEIVSVNSNEAQCPFSEG